eukprot:1394987-Rhodomonas_salina.2
MQQCHIHSSPSLSACSNPLCLPHSLPFPPLPSPRSVASLRAARANHTHMAAVTHTQTGTEAAHEGRWDR